MSFSLLVLHLAAAATLLIWAVRMVRTGVERAHGAALRRILHRAEGGRLRAAGAGAAIAVLLQSSTAVAMLAAGFAASGALGLATGLAMLLGADVGSALVVQILSVDLSWLMPFLLIAGGWLFLKGASRGVKQTGRILMGIALILLSLRMIGEATEPLRASTFLPIVVGYLRDDFVTAFLLGALFTWLIHSSVAAILLFMALAAEGVLPVELGLSLMLGANLGGGLIAVGLTRGAAPDAQRLPLGNFAFRALGAVAALLTVHFLEPPLHLAGGDAARQIVNLHLGFNLALALLCLPLTGPMEQLLRWAVPEAGPSEQGPDLLAARVSALDRSVLRSPGRALASTTRELLRMSEIIEMMLRPVMELYESGDRERIKRIRRLDQEVNAAHSQIKLYLAELSRGTMSADEAQRSMELAGFAINLEHVGDIVAKSLLQLAAEKADHRLRFSREGWRELTDLHARVLNNMQIALNVLVSGDYNSARQLVEEKDRMRELERLSRQRHLQRLQSGARESVETSEIHLETVRALKEINSLFATIAYPILTESGDLLESRLAERA